MARTINPETEQWLERTPRELEERWPGLSAAFPGWPDPNPATITLSSLTIPTALNTAEAVLIGTLPLHATEQAVKAVLARKSTKAGIGFSHIINRARSRDYLPDAEHFKVTPTYIRRTVFPEAVNHALGRIDPDLPLKEFLGRFYYEVGRRAQLFSGDERIQRKPKAKCEQCESACPTKGADRGKCPKCGHENFYLSDAAFWREKVVPHKTTEEYADGEMVGEVEPPLVIPAEQENLVALYEKLEALTHAEKEIFQLTLKGRDPDKIARETNRKRSTVDNHLANIQKKLKPV